MQINSTTPIRCVAYFRKSNNDDGGSVAQQQEWARTAAPEENFTLIAEFTDQAKPGHETAKRTAFHAMLAFCQEQHRQGSPVEAIVCWNPNRFSRSDSHETSWFLWEFRRAGVHKMFTASNGWRDFRKMQDRVIANIEQDTSHLPYVVNLAHDSTRGHIDAADRGQWNGGPAPYGYRVHHVEKIVDGKWKRIPEKLERVEEEAAIVEWLFRQYADTDTSMNALAFRLNKDGVPSPQRKGLWSQSTVRTILANRKYLGHMVYGERTEGKFWGVVDMKVKEREEPGKCRWKPKESAIVREDKHEAIIDQDTFDRVQAKMVARRKVKTPLQGGGDLLLSGLLICGHCGRHLTARRQRSRRKGHVAVYRRLYVCAGYNAHGKAQCTYNTLPEVELLACLARKIRDDYLNPERLADLRQEIAEQCARDEQGNGKEVCTEVRRIEKQLQELERKVATGTRRLLTEEDEKLVPVLRRDLQELQQERDRLAEELHKAQLPPPGKEATEAHIAAAEALLQRLDEFFCRWRAGRGPGGPASPDRQGGAILVARNERQSDFLPVRAGADLPEG
jgi:hypothetical protein